LDSDVEDIPDCLTNDESVFETAGEAEVEYCQSRDSEAGSLEHSDGEAVETTPKRKEVPIETRKGRRKAVETRGSVAQEAESSNLSAPKRQQTQVACETRKGRRKSIKTTASVAQKAASPEESDDEAIEIAQKRQKQGAREVPKNWRKT